MLIIEGVLVIVVSIPRLGHWTYKETAITIRLRKKSTCRRQLGTEVRQLVGELVHQVMFVRVGVREHRFALGLVAVL